MCLYTLFSLYLVRIAFQSRGKSSSLKQLSIMVVELQIILFFYYLGCGIIKTFQRTNIILKKLIKFESVLHLKSHLQLIKQWMKINDSQQSKSQTNFQWKMNQQSSKDYLSSERSDKEKSVLAPPTINSSYREAQILLSIAIVILSTLWVQITMQRHAPFVRASQSYFNQIILEHYSQDIYEGKDVIYWKTGEYYRYQDILDVYGRLNDTLYDLSTNSLFVLPQQYNEAEAQVELLAKYGIPKENRITQLKEYRSTLMQLSSLFEQTFMNRTFYDSLWQAQLLVSVPIIYRGDSCTLSIQLNSELYSSIMMSFDLNIDILDRDDNLVKGTFRDGNLGMRKIYDAHNMQLSIPYILWIILVLYLILFVLQFKFVLKRNQSVTQNLRAKIKEQKRIEKLLEEVNRSQSNLQGLKVNDSSNESKEEDVDLTDENFQIPSKYQLPILVRMKKVGVYYISQLLISFISLMTCYNSHNGIICFLAWVKLMVYLTHTKNKYMVGFLLEEAVPIYLKIVLNIFLLVTAFVLFNSLVYPTTIKFQTLKLGYFEYVFNYFQYGIYENFILAFEQYGLMAQFFYFVQLIYLLYIGNNILQSVLANQVMKNSYVQTVKQMIDELKTECPACGADPKQQIKHSDIFLSEIPKKKSQFISKIIKEGKRNSQNESSIMKDSYEIVVTSPLLSPFFPSKVQKNQSQKFMSPKLKNGNFQKKLKEINKKMQKEQFSQSKIDQINELNQKYDGSKHLKLEISQSKIDQNTQGKYHHQIKSKVQLLFRKIDNFNQIHNNKNKSSKKISIKIDDKIVRAKAEILTNLLQKVQNLKSKISEAIE